MSSDRPYRRALVRDAAVDEIRRFAGIQFDPHFAKEFLVILESGACDIDPAIVADAVADAHSKIEPANAATQIGA
ncbi:MAG: hypothetical protein JRF15_09470 [Deltaproteobacteria bacterium]|jgi:HD-GYP domain-containing protein (c-di-GMP phosphodiesterase class II)|nr:hypothetical protein [Deltaproteobacteria bacterium]